MQKRFQGGIILASASPRRKKLLTEAGYAFTVVSSGVDETAFNFASVDIGEYAGMLALAKAGKVARRYPDSVVIGADTVVDFNGEIIGKPADEREAEQITRKLFGAVHKVITGLAIARLSDGIELVESDTTIVYPRKLSEEQIAEHIKSNSWQGKAGAYRIQEKGDEFVERIEGSFTNVMGMPMELLGEMLGKIQ